MTEKGLVSMSRFGKEMWIKINFFVVGRMVVNVANVFVNTALHTYHLLYYYL